MLFSQLHWLLTDNEKNKYSSLSLPTNNGRKVSGIVSDVYCFTMSILYRVCHSETS